MSVSAICGANSPYGGICVKRRGHNGDHWDGEHSWPLGLALSMALGVVRLVTATIGPPVFLWAVFLGGPWPLADAIAAASLASWLGLLWTSRASTQHHDSEG